MRLMDRILSETRTIYDVVLVSSVEAALDDWMKNCRLPGLLLGGCALGLYARPRVTLDVDLLYYSEADIPVRVEGFKKIRPHAFEHLKTGVEVEVLSPSFLKLPPEVLDYLSSTSVQSGNVRVVSLKGLVLAKLSRASRRDQGDIEDVIKVNKTPFEFYNDLPLNDAQKSLLRDICHEVLGPPDEPVKQGVEPTDQEIRDFMERYPDYSFYGARERLRELAGSHRTDTPVGVITGSLISPRRGRT